MAGELRYFTSEEVSNILGVHVSSVKRWTNQGKLECIRTAGGHRKFLFSHIADFLSRNEDKVQQAHLFPIHSEKDLEISYNILKGNFSELQEYILNQALHQNRETVMRVLNGLYLAQYPLHEIYDRLITPVMHRLGDLWEKEALTVFEEHFASQTIRDAIVRLQGTLKFPGEKNGTAVCLTFSTELHDIAIKMVDHILEERGFRVLFSGQLSPLFSIDRIFQQQEFDRVYLSCTYVGDRNLMQFELSHLIDLCGKYERRLFVGGQGLEQLSYDGSEITARLESFKDVYDS